MIIAAGGWLKFKITSELHAVLYRRLQLEIDSLLATKLQHPHADVSIKQDRLLSIVKDLLV